MTIDVCHIVTVGLIRYDSPLGVAIIIVLDVIVLVAGLGFVFLRISRQREQLYKQFDQYLNEHGWQQSLSLPDTAIAPLLATNFSVDAPLSGYTCAHVLRANSAALYLGVGKWADGRTGAADTVVVATAELRAPVECLVATDSQTPEASLPGLNLMCVRSRRDKGNDLYVYLHGKQSTEDRRVAKTIQIIRLIFDGAESTLAPSCVALLRSGGMVIRGPSLRVGKKFGSSVEPLVVGAGLLLDRCEAVWRENGE